MMGAVSFSIDPDAVAVLVDLLRLNVFVETGTFHGDSVAAVADRFSRVYSIEIEPTLYRNARDRFAGRSEIDIRLGRSGEVLAQLRAEGAWARRRALFWLDAHWCESAGADPAGQCPLLDELLAIGVVAQAAVIAIDDARLFLAPPPAQYVVRDWPRFDDVLAAIRACAPKHRIIVFNDVIWAVPNQAIAALETYAIRNCIDWLDAAEKARTYDRVRAQLLEKEAEIGRLAATAAERHLVIDELSAHERHKAIVQAARIGELERVAEERRCLLEKTHAEAEHRLEEFKAVIKTYERQIKELERVAEERRCALEGTHADAEQGFQEYKAIIQTQECRIKELEQVAEQRKSALEKARSDANDSLHEWTAMVKTQEDRIAGLEKVAEERRLVLERVHADAERGHNELMRTIKAHEERNAELERLLAEARFDLLKANETLRSHSVTAERSSE